MKYISRAKRKGMRSKGQMKSFKNQILTYFGKNRRFLILLEEKFSDT